MKGILISIAFFTAASVILNEACPEEYISEDLELLVDKPDSFIVDGWYTAKVTYSNHKKITRTTSKLKVQIQDNKVIKIELGNGKILQAGEAQSDYFFSGGLLNFEYDLRIKEKKARTSVKIKGVNGNLSFYEIAII